MSDKEFQDAVQKYSVDAMRNAKTEYEDNLHDILQSDLAKSLNFTKEQKQFIIDYTLAQSKTTIQASVYSTLKVIEQMQNDS